MSYVRDTINSEIRLEGDGFGESTFRFRLPGAPAAAKRMQVVFRAGWDTHAAGITSFDPYAWNHTNMFGLGFSDTINTFPVPFDLNSIGIPSDFFGWINLAPMLATGSSTWPPNPATTLEYNRWGLDCANAFNSGTFSNTLYRLAKMGCSDNGASHSQFTHFLNGAGAIMLTSWRLSSGDTTNYPVALPATPTGIAAFVGGWDVWASAINKSMFATMQFAYNSPGWEGDDMFQVFTTTTANAFRRTSTQTLHGDVTSNWRTDLNTVHFPRYLKGRYSGHDQKMIFKEARVRYYDWDNNELEAA